MSGCTSCEGFGITVGLHCVLIICNKCCTERVPRSWNHPKHTSWSSCTLMRLSQMRFFFWFAILTRYANTDNACLEAIQMLDRPRAYCVQYIEIMCMWYMWIVTRCWLDGWWQLIRSVLPRCMLLPRCVVLPRCMLLNVYQDVWSYQDVRYSMCTKMLIC